MVKLIAFLKRSPDLTPEAFQEHWRTRHARLVVRQPGLRRYVQNHTRLSGYATHAPAWDGIAEAWFDDTQAMRALAARAEYRAVRDDEANFLDVPAMRTVITEEVVMMDAPAPKEGVKNLAMLEKRADVSIAEFGRHWRGVHAQLALTLPGLRRFVQSHTRAGIYRSGRTPFCDGVASTWFDDSEAFRIAATSAELAAVIEDEANFLVPGPRPFVLAKELEIPI